MQVGISDNFAWPRPITQFSAFGINPLPPRETSLWSSENSPGLEEILKPLLLPSLRDGRHHKNGNSSRVQMSRRESLFLLAFFPHYVMPWLETYLLLLPLPFSLFGQLVFLFLFQFRKWRESCGGKLGRQRWAP